MDWKYNNPKFHIAKPKNKLKWGLHTAIVNRFNKGEAGDKPYVEVSFYYTPDPLWNQRDRIFVQTYRQSDRVNESFISKCIERHFNSRKLDKIMYGNELPEFSEL